MPANSNPVMFAHFARRERALQPSLKQHRLRLHEYARRCTVSANLTIRLSDEQKQQLDRLAESTGRSRAFHADQAIRRYLAEEAWQIQETLEGIEEAEAGDFATDGEMAESFAKWGVNAR
jgi:RHH-type rel operon transcriptional repressor/antitoxin RelB